MMKPLLPRLASVACAGIACAGAAFAQPSTPTTPTPPMPPHAPHVEIRTLEHMMGGTYLGVIPSDVTADKARTLGMNEPTGVLLEQVLDDSPAKGAGLEKNDVIVSWNGTKVESAAQLRRLIHETPADRTVHIGYLRNGAPHDADVKLVEHKGPTTQMFKMLNDSLVRLGKVLPEQLEAELGKLKDLPRDGKGGMFMQYAFGANGRMGATLQDVSPQLAKYFGLNDRTGALVGSVREKSPAADGGLQAGDVIVEIDGQKVATPFDVQHIIAGKPEGDVSVKVMRDKAERTLTVHLKAQEKGSMDMNNLFEGSMPFEGTDPFQEFDRPFRMFMEFPNGDYGINDDTEEQEIEVAPPADGDAIGNPRLGNLLPSEAPHARVRTHIMRTPFTPSVPVPPPPAAHAVEM